MVGWNWMDRVGDARGKVDGNESELDLIRRENI